MPPNRWDDEESSGDEKPTVAVRAAKSKWDDEEDDNEVVESWDAAADSEEEREKAAKESAKKEKEALEKKSRSQRIEEHKNANAAQKAAAERAKEEPENESEADRKKRLQQIEIENDMKVAEILFSNVNLSIARSSAGSGAGVATATPPSSNNVKSGVTIAIGNTSFSSSVIEEVNDDDNKEGITGTGAGNDLKRKAISVADPKDSTKSIDLSILPIFNPLTKEQFTKLRTTLEPLITTNKSKPNYPLFAQEFVRSIARDMPSEQIKKIAAIVTALANEKLKEEKAAEKPKKKGNKKAQLSQVTKESDRVDLNAYDEYDDDDFM